MPFSVSFAQLLSFVYAPLPVATHHSQLSQHVSNSHDGKEPRVCVRHLAQSNDGTQTAPQKTPPEGSHSVAFPMDLKLAALRAVQRILTPKTPDVFNHRFAGTTVQNFRPGR